MTRAHRFPVLSMLAAGLLVAVATVTPPAHAAPPVEGSNAPLPDKGVVNLTPTQGNHVKGKITLSDSDEGLRITGTVKGLSPGKHGFHIHEYGDLSDPEGKSAGSHFNPTDEKHGAPDDKQHHAGDLGNIEANDDGEAEVDVTAPWLKLHFLLGRSIVVHSGADDFESQPSGDAGSRVSLGVIGVADSSWFE